MKHGEKVKQKTYFFDQNVNQIGPKAALISEATTDILINIHSPTLWSSGAVVIKLFTKPFFEVWTVEEIEEMKDGRKV